MTLQYVFNTACIQRQTEQNFLALPYRWQRTNPTDARKQESFQDPRPAEPQTAGGTGLMEVNGGSVLFWAGAAMSSVFPCPLQYTTLIAASVRLSWEKQTHVTAA